LDLHVILEVKMKNNDASTMGLPYIVNPMTWLWRSLDFSQVIAHKMTKYLKLVKIAKVQVINYVVDEKHFNNLNFIKSKLCNWLTTHLNLLVWMFSQQLYTLENFPYPKVVATWKDMIS
jgi:hypothetical protein